MPTGQVFPAIVIAGVAALFASGATAASLPKATPVAGQASSAVIQAQYYPPRRYWRRYGPGPYVVPPVAPVAPVVPVVPPVVVEQPVIVPLRPTSCGEFHYWNGVACVDARYNKPYLGPRP
jgi:hypothetical protein